VRCARADDGQELRRSGVVGRLVILGFGDVEAAAEAVFNGALVDGERVAAAHGEMIANVLSCYPNYMESNPDQNVMWKVFVSWKAYTLIAVAFWLMSVLLAGSAAGNAAMVAT